MIVDLNLEPLTNESVVFDQEEPPYGGVSKGRLVHNVAVNADKKVEIGEFKSLQ